VYLSAVPVALVPPGVVTVISTVPADPAGETAVSFVALTNVTEVPAFAPNLTVAPLTNPVPVIVTVVPPAVGPADGLTAVTAGTAALLYLSAVPVALVPPGVVTVISTLPADPAGETAVSFVALTNVTEVPAFAPNLTVAPLTNPV